MALSLERRFTISKGPLQGLVLSAQVSWYPTAVVYDKNLLLRKDPPKRHSDSYSVS